MKVIQIEIEEIANGFVVTLFDSDGPSDLDKTVHVASFEEVMKLLDDWYKKQLKDREVSESEFS